MPMPESSYIFDSRHVLRSLDSSDVSHTSHAGKHCPAAQCAHMWHVTDIQEAALHGMQVICFMMGWTCSLR